MHYPRNIEIKIGLNVFISIFLQHISHITICNFLGLEQKRIAYLVLLLVIDQPSPLGEEIQIKTKIKQT